MRGAGTMSTNLAEVVDDHGDEASLDDGLHLLLVARSDVGQEPHSLLQHHTTLLVVSCLVGLFVFYVC